MIVATNNVDTQSFIAFVEPCSSQIIESLSITIVKIIIGKSATDTFLSKPRLCISMLVTKIKIITLVNTTVNLGTNKSFNLSKKNLTANPKAIMTENKHKPLINFVSLNEIAIRTGIKVPRLLMPIIFLIITMIIAPIGNNNKI